MERGYIKTYNWVMKLLQNCDFEESSKRLELRQISQNKVLINFLERIYSITKDSIELVEQKIRWTPKTEGYEYNLKSVLGYYLLSEANVDPVNDFCTLGYFSCGIFRNNTINDIFSGPLERVYGRNYEKFREIAEKTGMTFEMEKSSEKYIWKYTLLPKVPVKIIYYEGDDEYPTKLQILYDKTAIKLFKFEPLAVLHGCFINGLAALGENT
jgi:hypothetical protein